MFSCTWHLWRFALSIWTLKVKTGKAADRLEAKVGIPGKPGPLGTLGRWVEAARVRNNWESRKKAINSKIKICMYLMSFMCVSVHMWRSENNFGESVLFFYTFKKIDVFFLDESIITSFSFSLFLAPMYSPSLSNSWSFSNRCPKYINTTCTIFVMLPVCTWFQDRPFGTEQPIAVLFLGDIYFFSSQRS